MTRIAECLQRAGELADVSDSARLDVEVMLAHCLGKSRTWLYTWSDRELTAEELVRFESMLTRRLRGEPVAYIIGEREFWSLPLAVAPSTLIPRPDTERLVELTLALALPMQARVLDLGTGTGAIALALASERPDWQLLAVDMSAAAVALAETNRNRCQLSNVSVRQSNWFAAVTETGFAAIVSNPPYIDAADPHLGQGDVRFEPHTALIAADHGLADIRQIATESVGRLAVGGWLLVEHGYQQGEAVREIFRGAGFSQVRTERDYGDNERVTMGCRE